MKEKLLVVIQGPTAVGKTSTTIALAKNFQSEIVSADSRQLYKEMNIGTAVPSSDELNEVNHHFIQSHSIHDSYNASKYEFEALSCIETLHKKHDIVFLGGGTGLYIDAVCKGIDDLPAIDPELRKSLQGIYENHGLEYIRRELKMHDSNYFEKVDLSNPKRILKALEVFHMTGKPYSSFLTNQHKKRPFKIIKVGLNRERAELHDRINQRVLQMVDQGLIKEAEALIPFKDLNALNTVGYKEVFQYLTGEYSLDRSIELIQRNTRRFARRQVTWFNRYPETQWFHPDQTSEMVKFIQGNTRSAS